MGGATDRQEAALIVSALTTGHGVMRSCLRNYLIAIPRFDHARRHAQAS